MLKSSYGSTSSAMISELHAQMVDVSIEFAHVDVGSYDSSEVSRSGEVAARLASEFDVANESYSVSLLIDDKNSSERMTPNDVSLLILEASKWLQVDYVVFESRLAEYKLDLFENIKESHRVVVKKFVERYEMKSGRLACSHDIAIWHLMRLGKIAADAATVVPVGSRRGRIAKPFFAKRVVSILKDEDHDPEEKALDDILRHCTDETIPARIHRYFV